MRRPKHRYPQWLRVTVCLVPAACVIALCAAAIYGTPINFPLAASVGSLNAYIVRKIV
jgi:hypothetical protein